MSLPKATFLSLLKYARAELDKDFSKVLFSYDASSETVTLSSSATHTKFKSYGVPVTVKAGHAWTAPLANQVCIRDPAAGADAPPQYPLPPWESLEAMQASGMWDTVKEHDPLRVPSFAYKVNIDMLTLLCESIVGSTITLMVSPKFVAPSTMIANFKTVEEVPVGTKGSDRTALISRATDTIV